MVLQLFMVIMIFSFTERGEDEMMRYEDVIEKYNLLEVLKDEMYKLRKNENVDQVTELELKWNVLINEYARIRDFKDDKKLVTCNALGDDLEKYSNTQRNCKYHFKFKDKCDSCNFYIEELKEFYSQMNEIKNAMKMIEIEINNEEVYI